MGFWAGFDGAGFVLEVRSAVLIFDFVNFFMK